MDYAGLIALDLDGTLLEKENTLSSFAIDVIDQIAKKGYLVVLASGRPYRSIKPFYEKLKLNAPIICYNGGLTFHPLDGSFPKLEFLFGKEDIALISSRLEGKASSFMAETDKVIYLSEDDAFLSRYFWYEGMEKRYGSLTKINEDVHTYIFSPKDDSYEKEVEDIAYLETHHWSNAPYVELFHKDASKGAGLLHIASLLRISKKDIYAFGDGDNDFSMLSYSGHPYAVKGCKSSLLAKHFPSTKKSNLEDGVALELKELFLD